MTLLEAIAAAAQQPDNPRAQRRVGRLLGVELRNPDRTELAQARAALARALAADEDGAQDGYLLAVADVVRSFEADLIHAEQRQQDLLEARRAGWGDVLRILNDGPRLPSVLADTLGKSRPQVTSILSQMTQAGLVEKAPSTGDGRQRPRAITLRGHAALQSLGESEPGAVDIVRPTVAKRARPSRPHSARMDTEPTSATGDAER